MERSVEKKEWGLRGQGNLKEWNRRVREKEEKKGEGRNKIGKELRRREWGVEWRW